VVSLEARRAPLVCSLDRDTQESALQPYGGNIAKAVRLLLGSTRLRAAEVLMLSKSRYGGFTILFAKMIFENCQAIRYCSLLMRRQLVRARAHHKGESLDSI